MTEKLKQQIEKWIEIWDTQGEGKLVLVKDRNGNIKYFITKGGDLE